MNAEHTVVASELEGMAVKSMSLPFSVDQNAAIGILVARIKRLEEADRKLTVDKTKI